MSISRKDRQRIWFVGLGAVGVLGAFALVSSLVVSVKKSVGGEPSLGRCEDVVVEEGKPVQTAEARELEIKNAQDVLANYKDIKEMDFDTREIKAVVWTQCESMTRGYVQDLVVKKDSSAGLIELTQKELCQKCSTEPVETLAFVLGKRKMMSAAFPQ